MTNNRAAIYARISRDADGRAMGVGRQEEDCRALADRLGLSVVEVFTDNDIGASTRSRKRRRPGYEALLDGAREGRFGTILAYSNSRLTRRTLELEDLIVLHERHGVRIRTVVSGDDDLGTADGRMIARIKASVDAAEAERVSERARRAKDQRALSGTPLGGRRPYGYEPGGLIIREDEAARVREATAEILAGGSVRGLVARWNREGVPTSTGGQWGQSSLRAMLLRPRNAGLMVHRGAIVGAAAWPAIVPEEQWRALVDLLSDPGRRTSPGPERKYLGSGLFRCAVCGGTVVGGHANQLLVYRCRPGCVSRGMLEVDDLVTGVIIERLRRPDFADALAVAAAPGVDVPALELRTTVLRDRLNRLAKGYAAGVIDSLQLAAGSKVLRAELEGVRERIAAAYQGSALSGIADAPDPGERFMDADLARRRAVLDALVVVTLDKSGRGRPKGWAPGDSYFRPETVQIEWRGVTS
ncbi:recombinase family protein [Mobilicoccus pelagius]|uniref:Putative recombinase n=1 Tax=Mobilicoccus pelagius NBRC 104925 TaxID=1089455 RepID=H5UN88_9MICO|nr:recombinase family protein [Mobilicoccus pelagius]GAB47196.1 putative recombinase [Mobilicoccus pelagius NBRC 104925]